MSVDIQETDSGTKKEAKEATEETEKELTESLQARLEEWWAQVIMTAFDLCPKDTWTLAATIRREPAGYVGTDFEVVQGVSVVGEGEGLELINEVLVAGGLLINPKTGRIVDYAQAVHDGHISTGGTPVAPQPFLADALDMHAAELEDILLEACGKAEMTFGGMPTGVMGGG